MSSKSTVISGNKSIALLFVEIVNCIINLALLCYTCATIDNKNTKLIIRYNRITQ